jgi:hypothetical protein
MTAILAEAVSEMSFDTDAAAYITAVETADAASLPNNIKFAINNFVIGAKADGFWSAIKAACFLAGPATLNGALVPLVGPAPTNVGGLFVSGDYNQLTGLVGNGSTKYLNSNRSGTAESQNNQHLSLYASASASSGVIIGSGGGVVGASGINAATAENWPFRSRISAFDTPSRGTRSVVGATGFVGLSRSAGASMVTRIAGANETVSQVSTTALNLNFFVFARNNAGSPDAYSSPRLAWYSIGESLDLALLDARLATYMTAIATPTIFPRRRRSRSGGGVL